MRRCQNPYGPNGLVTAVCPRGFGSGLPGCPERHCCCARASLRAYQAAARRRALDPRTLATLPPRQTFWPGALSAFLIMLSNRPASAQVLMGMLMAILMPILGNVSLTQAHAEEALAVPNPEAFSGDIGAGVLHGASGILRVQAKTSAVPYLNFEAGRLFARIDTFGVKVLPLGGAHLELLGQVRSDGYHGGGWSERQNSAPIGVGTLQITPIGAFGLNVLHDFGASGGSLLQARYLAELPIGRLVLYPEVGLERQSSRYARYDLGTTAADAALAGRAYQPGAAQNAYLGGLIELSVSGPWMLNLYLRRVFTDRTLSNGPLVRPGHQDTALLSLAYRY